MMKRLCIFGVLIVAAMLVQDAMALPSGAYVDDKNKTWKGYTTYTEESFNVTLEWAVYEISALPSAFQGLDFPEGDNYLYTYQLFNSQDATKDVGFFQMQNINGQSIASVIHATGGVSDHQSPQDKEVTHDSTTDQGEWDWSTGIRSQMRSTYLFFSSVYGPVRGKYVIEEAAKEPPPGPDVPEPGTLTLLGAAVGMFIAKRTRKRQSQ
jgi:hypothetical protein